MRRKIWLSVLLGLVSGTVAGQVAVEEDREESTLDRLRRQASQMIDGLRQFDDWETHYQYQINAVERIYDQNGWDSEPDLFSLELLREVEQIPPWEVRERLDTVFAVVGDRYLLDESQEAMLQRLVFEQNFKLFRKHSGRIMEYAMEAIQTRVAGQPFEPEQVARWTELAEPVFRDSRRSFETMATQFMDVLDPEQRELVQADIDAANRRMDSLEQMAEGWKRGEWKASDWGLDHDPIQNPDGVGLDDEEISATGGQGGAKASGEEGRLSPAEQARLERRRKAEQQQRESQAEGGAAPASDPEMPPPDAKRDAKTGKGTKAAPDDEWARYVRAFIARYGLNDDQQQKAWLFYQDARKRADTTAKRLTRLSSADPDDARAQARLKEAQAQVQRDKDRLFDRMKARLERLPTRAQRRDAKSEP